MMGGFGLTGDFEVRTDTKLALVEPGLGEEGQ